MVLRRTQHCDLVDLRFHQDFNFKQIIPLLNNYFLFQLKLPVVKPLQVKPEPEVKPVAAAALEGDEDEAAIYSWPPKSGAFGPTNKISKGM